jgi:hypothetical protein
MEANRKARTRSITAADLTRIDQRLIEFHRSYQRIETALTSKGQKVPGQGTGTIKYHKLSHITRHIRLFGGLGEYLISDECSWCCVGSHVGLPAAATCLDFSLSRYMPCRTLQLQLL